MTRKTAKQKREWKVWVRVVGGRVVELRTKKLWTDREMARDDFVPATLTLSPTKKDRRKEKNDG